MIGCSHGETRDLETASHCRCTLCVCVCWCMTGCACEALSVCVCACLSVGPSAAGVSPAVAVRAGAWCIFASRCKVILGLIAQCQNGGQEVGRYGGGRRVITTSPFPAACKQNKWLLPETQSCTKEAAELCSYEWYDVCPYAMTDWAVVKRATIAVTSGFQSQVN